MAMLSESASYEERRSVLLGQKLAKVSPGMVVPPDVVAFARDMFAHASGLESDQILVNRFGFPPLPRPTGTGSHRLPANVRLEHAGHPVFWLDEKAASRRPGETDDHWAIRLFTELHARGWWDAESGEWLNVLSFARWDIDDPADRERIQAYQAGEPDADLAKVVIPLAAEGMTDLDQPYEYATTVIDLLTPVLREIDEQAIDEIHVAFLLAQGHLGLSFDEMAGDLVAALSAFHEATRAEVPGPAAWQRVADVAHGLSDRVDDAHRAVIDASGPLLAASAVSESDYVHGVDVLAAEVQQAENERHRRFAEMLSELRSRPGDDYRFRAVVDEMRVWFVSAQSRLHDVFVQTERIGNEGDYVAPVEAAPEDEDDVILPPMPGERLRRPARPVPSAETIFDTDTE